MAVITIVDPILGLYQKLGDPNEAASFNIAAGVTTTGISGSGGGGVTVIADGGTLTGTYQGDVLCEGSATLAGNVTVQGKLTVLSDLINNAGHELIVNGDLIVINNFEFDHSDPNAVQSNVTIEGNFIIKGLYLKFLQGGQSEARLRVGGDLISSNGGVNGTQIDAYGNNNTAGLEIVVYGDMSGFSAINIYGGNATAGGQGGAGGDLEIYGSYTGQGHIDLYGGDGLTFGNGGGGGNLHCHGNIALGDYDIRMYGGNAQDNNAGNGGNFTCDGTLSVEDLDLYGGDVTVTTTGGQGGAGGSISISGRFGSANGVDSRGGSGGGVGFSGGVGGIIQVDGNLTVDGGITISGGSCTDGNAAGNGGYIEVTCDMSVEGVNAVGGSGTNCNGGNGGYIDVQGTISINSSSTLISTEGGSCTSTSNDHTAGNGGYINCGTLIWPSGTIVTSGGLRNGTTTSAGAGAASSSAGNITVYGDMIVSELYMSGGDVNTEYKSFAGGAGGTLTVEGSLTVQSDAELLGGSARAYDGGVSGRVYVNGGPANCYNLTIQGGASNPEPRIGGDGPATRGSVRDSSFRRGIDAQSLVYKDGTETVGSSPATAAAILQIAGSCNINSLDVENRADVKVKGTGDLPITLKIGTMPSKKKLNNSDDAETVDITAISGGLDGNIFSYGTTGGEWYYHAGTSLTPP